MQRSSDSNFNLQTPHDLCFHIDEKLSFFSPHRQQTAIFTMRKILRLVKSIRSEIISQCTMDVIVVASTTTACKSYFTILSWVYLLKNKHFNKRPYNWLKVSLEGEFFVEVVRPEDMTRMNMLIIQVGFIRWEIGNISTVFHEHSTMRRIVLMYLVRLAVT